jgi:uncharacterized SAM-binding protein YcdF (DUF218 family)
MYRLILILGSGNDGEGRLSPTALERLDEGIAEYRRRPGSAIVPTGGFGSHFNTTARPHAEYAREYLLARGIPESDVLPHLESGNTVEDAILARPLLEAEAGAAITLVTSDYHIERARFIFSTLFPGRRISYSAARSGLPPDRIEALHAHEKSAIARMAREGIVYGTEIWKT